MNKAVKAYQTVSKKYQGAGRTQSLELAKKLSFDDIEEGYAEGRKTNNKSMENVFFMAGQFKFRGTTA